jgi:hypothetical protein
VQENTDDTREISVDLIYNACYGAPNIIAITANVDDIFKYICFKWCFIVKASHSCIKLLLLFLFYYIRVNKFFL